MLHGKRQSIMDLHDAYPESIGEGSPQVNDQLYANTIKSIIAQEGDTDTNACIVGAMVGAADGLKNIPEHML